MEIDFSVGRGGAKNAKPMHAPKIQMAIMLQRRKERDTLVRKIMKKEGLKYRQASAFVKENNLF